MAEKNPQPSHQETELLSQSESFISIPRPLVAKIFGVSAVILLILAAYFFGKGDTPTKTNTSTTSASPTATSVKNPSSYASPTTVNNKVVYPSPEIKRTVNDAGSIVDQSPYAIVTSALQTRDSALLKENMYDTVSFSKFATSYSSDKTKDEAVLALYAILDTSASWNFDIDDATNYKAGLQLVSRMTPKIIGHSDSTVLVLISDQNGIINEIMTADIALLE